MAINIFRVNITWFCYGNLGSYKCINWSKEDELLNRINFVQRWRSSSASSNTRNEYSESKARDKKARKSLGFEDETGTISEATNKTKKNSLRKKKKTKGHDVQKNVGFCENDDIMADIDTKSLGSICLVIDPVEETLSLYSGK